MSQPADVVWGPHAQDPNHALIKVLSEIVEVVISHAHLNCVVTLGDVGGVRDKLSPLALSEVLSHSEGLISVDGVLLTWSKLISMVPLNVSLTSATVIAAVKVSELIRLVTCVGSGSERPGIGLHEVPLRAESSLVLSSAEIQSIR